MRFPGYSRRIARWLCLAATIAAPPAMAQDAARKVGRIISPFAAGGASDTQARLIAKRLGEQMGQTFVVESRLGAGGLIGAEVVAKSPPDCQTMLMTTSSLAVNATLFKEVSFNPVRDLAPLSLLSSAPLVLAVHPSTSVKSVRDLVAFANKHPGKLNAASNGVGSSNHVALEMFKQAAKIQVAHIPYKGLAPALTAILVGEVDFTFASPLAVQPHIKSGRVRAIAVTTATKSRAFPDLPTVNSVYPGFAADIWFAMFCAGGTPAPVLARFNAEVVKALRSPEMSTVLAREGVDIVGSSPEDFAGYFKKEIAKYAQIIKAGNITAQ